jgi:hypothetical protein
MEGILWRTCKISIWKLKIVTIQPRQKGEKKGDCGNDIPEIPEMDDEPVESNSMNANKTFAMIGTESELFTQRRFTGRNK